MQARHGQLNAMGWFGNVGIATPANPADMQPAGDALLSSTLPPTSRCSSCEPLYTCRQILLTCSLLVMRYFPVRFLKLLVVTPANFCVTCW